MLIFIFIIYLVILFFPFWKSKKREKMNFFSPQVIFSLLTAFYSVPFLIFFFFDPLIIDENVRLLIGAKMENVMFKFLFYQTIFIIFFYWGVYSTKKNKTKINLFDINLSAKYYYITYLILLFISLSLVINFIISVGGIYELILQFANRDELTDGNQLLLLSTSSLINIAGCFLMKYMSIKGFKLKSLFINLFCSFIVLSAFGGRSPFILYLLMMLCCYNYLIKRINFFKVKFIIPFVFLFCFVIIMPLLRSKEVDLTDINKLIFDNVLVFFSGNEYVNIQLLIHNYFETHPFWYGTSYKGLFYMFVPRSLFPDKPPIDEGVYIFNLFYRGDPFTNESISSWPPSTFGIFYANFGFLGVIFGGYIHGFLLKKIENMFDGTKCNPFILCLYSFMVIKFQLTAYYFANTIYLLGFISILYVLVSRMFPKYKRIY